MLSSRSNRPIGSSTTSRRNISPLGRTPSQSPTPEFAPSSPMFNPSRSPTPEFSPSSPMFNPSRSPTPEFSPSSPIFRNTSDGDGQEYYPSSPAYSRSPGRSTPHPSSPTYAPLSPAYSRSTDPVSTEWQNGLGGITITPRENSDRSPQKEGDQGAKEK